MEMPAKYKCSSHEYFMCDEIDIWFWPFLSIFPEEDVIPDFLTVKSVIWFDHWFYLIN